MNNTKRALAQSLKQLLEKKPITKISISDITQNCGVSRMTFYYHFKDIYDLVEWISEQDVLAALNSSAHYDSWQDMCVALLEAVRANKSFMLSVYHSLDSVQLQHYLTHMTERMLYASIEDKRVSKVPDLEESRYAVSFCLYGFTGVIIAWVKDDMKEEPAAVVRQVSQTLEKALCAQKGN